MDAFSEVLSGVRLKGAVFFRADFSAPWGLNSPHSSAMASTLAPGAPHLIIYHLVVEGTARARADGVPDLDLAAGDVVVLPHGHAHELGVGRGRRGSRTRRCGGRSRRATCHRCRAAAAARRPGSSAGTWRAIRCCAARSSKACRRS